jgi:branched-chain amino acid transport system substrate-binding protein
MIRANSAWRASVVLAAASLALTACGDDGGSNGNGDGDIKGDGTLTIGTLLPETGDLAFLGPPEVAGVKLAVNEINAAGGVNGKDVVLHESDSGDGTPDIAGASVDGLLAQDVDAIVGAAASGVSITVIDKITGEGVIHFSPANTAPVFDDYEDGGLYFRTAPSDRLQGQVIANMAVEDGFSNVAVIARQDAYGEGLAAQTVATLEEKGANVAAHVLYAADAENYTAEVNEVAASNPDAIVLIAFDETKKLVPQFIKKGVGPQDVQFYLVDGNTADYSAESFDLEGTKGTIPVGGDPDPVFNERLSEAYGSPLDDFTYGPQSYDAVIMIALAAIAAGDDDGATVAAEIINISKDGTKCSTFADCVELLDQGEDIDYEGASGPTDMNDTGSPNKGTIGIQLYGSDNTYTQIDMISGILN